MTPYVFVRVVIRPHPDACPYERLGATAQSALLISTILALDRSCNKLFDSFCRIADLSSQAHNYCCKPMKIRARDSTVLRWDKDVDIACQNMFYFGLEVCLLYFALTVVPRNMVRNTISEPIEL